MAAESYWDEHPYDGTGGNGSGGSGGGGASGGGWGGGGSSSGGGSGGWGSDGATSTPDPTGWGGDLNINPPFLKRTSRSGHLIRDGSGLLLTGKKACSPVPSVVLYIDGDDTRRHTACLLWQLDDPQRSFTSENLPASAKNGADRPARYGTVSWMLPGVFRLLAKWQAGHYDYAKINRALFLVFGIGLGWQKLALTNWTTIATIEITNEYQIWVNGIRGSIRGNAQYLPEE